MSKTLGEISAIYTEANRRVREMDERREAALAAVGPWPAWRCRLGWHRPTLVMEGDVGYFDSYRRYECPGPCEAYWLSRNGGRRFRA